MQYAGQYSYHQSAGNRFFDGKNFAFMMFFNTCLEKDFYLFCVQELDQVENEDTDANPDWPHFCLYVDGNGYYTFTIRLVDNENRVVWRKKTTTLQVALGWNFVGFYLDEIYEFSYIFMYSRNENQANQQTYDTIMAGYYDETNDDEAETNSVLVIGCRVLTDFTAVDNDHVYGMCMRGWIQYFESDNLDGRNDFLLNYDTALEWHAFHNDGGNFCNMRVLPNLCFSTFTIQ